MTDSRSARQEPAGQWKTLQLPLGVNVGRQRSFHVLGSVRRSLHLTEQLFSLHGTLLSADATALSRLSRWLRDLHGSSITDAQLLQAVVVHELSHLLIIDLGRDGQLDLQALRDDLGAAGTSSLTGRFRQLFPPGIGGPGLLPELSALEELLLVYLHNRNPAFSMLRPALDDTELQSEPAYRRLDELFGGLYEGLPTADAAPLLLAGLRRLLAAQLSAPADLQAQLDFLLRQLATGGNVPESVTGKVLLARDLLAEQLPRHGPPALAGAGAPEERGDLLPLAAPARESSEQPWMRDAVVSARNCLVWLSQLSSHYGRDISRLDDIPDSELKQLRDSGVTALWLIGIWQRSEASKRIKRLKGQEDAAASAYSIADYVISRELGGQEALERLRERCRGFGLRLVADMVPNHTALDSRWVLEHPDRFLQLTEPPQPGYTFDGPELSPDPAVSIRLEDHYWDDTDAAVVFRRTGLTDGSSRYIYHGNDGTGLPWNDTAQLDYRNPETREAVLQLMVDIASQFELIRFDAAMTLVSRHIQRLWYPPPGAGGAIFSRSLHGSTPSAELQQQLPAEFWSEAVNRLNREAPGTMLIAEAFWMLEEYFVQNLGLHRVYNSAFMHMIRDGDNAGFRAQLSRALESDPGLPGRFVNFLTNPDEATAAGQFGTGDRYFAACTLLVTLPGLPLIGHGQFEGLKEKYGMEFSRPRLAEQPDEAVVRRHQQQIVPLLRQRWLFSGTERFELLEFEAAGGTVQDVIAFSNAAGSLKAVVLVNNSLHSVAGRPVRSVPRLRADGSVSALGLHEVLGAPEGATHVSWRLLTDGLEYFSPLGTVDGFGPEFSLGPYGTMVLTDFRFHTQGDGLRFDLLDARRGFADVRDAASRAAWQPLREWLLALSGSPAAAPPRDGLRISVRLEEQVLHRARRLHALRGEGPLADAFPELTDDLNIWLLLQGLDGGAELLTGLVPELPEPYRTLPWRPTADWWRRQDLQRELGVQADGRFSQAAFGRLAAAFALRGALRAGPGPAAELWLALRAARDFSGGLLSRLLRLFGGHSGE